MELKQLRYMVAVFMFVEKDVRSSSFGLFDALNSSINVQMIL